MYNVSTHTYPHNETAQRNVSLVPTLIQLDSVHNAVQVKNEMVSVVVRFYFINIYPSGHLTLEQR